MKLNKIKNYNLGLLKNKKINALIFFFFILLVTNACEPDPKMISYGSNDFGQLGFENTSWDDRPLHEGYFHSWAGENFSLVHRISWDDYGTQVNELVCRGDNDLGQCDLPPELNEWINLYGFNQWGNKVDLGFNHGIVAIDTTSYQGLPNQNWLVSWGDNTYGQLDFPEILDTTIILQMIAGGNHNIALIGDTVTLDTANAWGYNLIDTVNLRLVSWGDNQYGQCNVPQSVQNISDDIDPTSFRVYAGGNHNVIVYDSLGTNKMVAWGDNQYGQCETLSENQLNGPNFLLNQGGVPGGPPAYIDQIYCGYNHNVAILYNPNEDISNNQNNDIDSLYILDFEDNYYYYYYSYLAARPVTLVAWGDNTYGQCDIPDVDGLIEGFDAGGYHNNIAFKTNHIWTPESSTFPYRDIIGWGMNDHGQNDFPIRYYVNTNTAPSYGPGPGGPGDSPPEITLGGRHSLVRGAQVYRSPNIDFNFPEQFTGSLGDTVFQTLTIQNIGPDTVVIDSVVLFGEENTIASAPPFYHNFSDPETLFFEDDLSFEIYCIYDTSHNNTEYAYMKIYNKGWWEDSTQINLSSYFAPQVSVGNNFTVFRGGFEETVYQPLLIRNDGVDTVIIDSIVIQQYLNGDEPPNFEPGFSYETLGEENYILPNDSIQIYFSATFNYLSQMSFNGNVRVYLRTYNSMSLSYGISAMRYLGVGENLSLSNLYEANIYYCDGPWLTSSSDNSFQLIDLGDNSNLTNVHYFDFGALDTSSNLGYIDEIDSLAGQFEDNNYFISLLATRICDNQNELFANQDQLIIFRDSWFDQMFPPHVESVVINHLQEITYADTFNYDLVANSIQLAIDDCGINCLSGSALTIDPNILEIEIPTGEIVIDTLTIENSVPYGLSFSMNAESGTDIASSVSFSDMTGTGGIMSEMQIPLDTIFSPATFSFWFKPTISNWSDGPEMPYTTFISPEGDGDSNIWEIILDDNQFFPRIGWKDDDTYVLSESGVLPVFWHHAVFVHDLSTQTLALYLNGVLEGSFSVSSDLYTGTGLGINSSGFTGYQGRLAQLSIWSTALSGPQVQAIYDSGINVDLVSDELELPEGGPLGYWKMNESNGDLAFDYSGSDRHAQLIGTYWSNELIQSDTPWLSVLVGGNQDIGPNETSIALININATELEPGIYNGLISLNPNHGPYDIISTVRLTITEQLDLLENELPRRFSLHQNYPNPFNPITTIRFELPEVSNVLIKVHDILGNEVYKNILNEKESGFHSIKWNAKNSNGESVSAGVYFYSLKAGEKFLKTKKMILLK